MADFPALELVHESKIADLLPDAPLSVEHEASGVLAKDGKYFVVFDNHTSVARLSEELVPHPMNGLFGMARVDGGYEGITYNADKNRYYLLVESRKQKSGRYRAELVEYDDALSYVQSRPLDFEFKTDNKGFEAVCHVRRGGQDYVLALCEGNKCKSGSKGRQPGGGRVQLFEKKKKRWSHVDTVKLPKSVLFEDYSGMTIDGNRVAVVSQQNSMLWIGVFEEAAWSWCDDGRTYQFPRTTDGDIAYGNVEGVAWITRSRLVTVSDRRKEDQPERFADKDQSIHVFDLPR
jgi:hypothetical protein